MFHLILFDLSAGGHHGQYVKQLVQYWSTHSYSGRLSVMITSKLLDRHQEILEITHQNPNIEIHILADFHPTGNLFQISKQKGQILNTCLNKIKPTHCLLMDFDLFQIPLGFKLRFKFPLVIYGIYFRPFLEVGRRITLRDGLSRYIQYTRKRMIFALSLQNPHLSCLFSLDPYFAKSYSSSKSRILPLPDGVEIQDPSLSSNVMKKRLGVEQPRRFVLFFGSIAKRKGIFEVLDAINLLADHDQQKLCMVVVGKVAHLDKDLLSGRISGLKRYTNVQFITEFRFVSDTEMTNLFFASDLVLLPYLHHVGSSGVLVRAALSGKPVLGCNFGLIGRYIRDYELGLSVKSDRPLEIANGISKWLNAPEEFPFNAVKAQDFGLRHSANQFSEVIFSQIYPESNA